MNLKAVISLLIILFSTEVFALAPIPYKEAINEADKVALVKVIKKETKSFTVELIKVYKGKILKKVITLDNLYEEQFKFISINSLCFILLDKENKVFFSDPCGTESVLILKEDKLVSGVFSYGNKKMDYQKNGLEKAIIATLKQIK